MCAARSAPAATASIFGALVRLTCAATAIAIAVWLLPASVHLVKWPPSGPVPVAMLAPPARLFAALAVAFALVCIAAVWQRHRPSAAAGLARVLSPLAILWLWVLPYLPWLPDRAPLLLLFAGPMKWAIAAVAVGRCLWLAVRHRVSTRSLRLRSPRVAVAATSFAVYLILGLRSVATIGFEADEPHYLVIAHQPARRPRSEHREQPRAWRPSRVLSGLRPDYLRRGIHGEIYSVHAPGLPSGTPRPTSPLQRALLPAPQQD